MFVSNKTRTLQRSYKFYPDTSTGSTYAAEAELDEDDVVCGDPWAVRVRAVNEMGPGPPEWYPIMVRTRKVVIAAVAGIEAYFVRYAFGHNIERINRLDATYAKGHA